MAGQRRTGRTVEQWNALTPGNRRRWIRAFGSEDAGLEAYRNGLSLTASQRGHATTPERPIQALLQPAKFPKYVGTHTAKLNELARSKGLKEHGIGPRGEKPETQDYYQSGGDFTWVVPRGTVSNIGPPDWHFSQVFRTVEEAQLYARRSWAPAGVVLIEDNRWISGEPYPEPTGDVYRYEVWFGYPVEKRRKSKKSPNRSNGKKETVETTQRQLNYAKQNKGRPLTPAQKKRIRKNENKGKK